MSEQGAVKAEAEDGTNLTVVTRSRGLGIGRKPL
jgi:hypothetical protein